MSGPLDYDDETDWAVPLDEQRHRLADRLDREKVGIYSDADLDALEREGIENA